MNETPITASAHRPGTQAGNLLRTVLRPGPTTRRARRVGHQGEIHVADVLALEHDDARVLADRPRELAVADVDRVDTRRTALEEDVGEPTGRGPDVERGHARGLDPERIEPLHELERAARD